MFHFHFLYVSQYFRTIHIVCVEDLLGGGRGGAGRLTPCFLFPFSLPNTFARHISCACDSLLGGVPILLCNCIPPPPKCAFRGSAPCFLRISLFVGVPILLHSTHCGFRVVLKATFSSIDTSCVCVPILFAQPFHCQAARQPRRSGVSMQEVRVRLHPAGLVKSRGRTQPPFCVQWKHSRSLMWKRARSNAIHRRGGKRYRIETEFAACRRKLKHSQATLKTQRFKVEFQNQVLRMGWGFGSGFGFALVWHFVCVLSWWRPQKGH